MSTKVIVTIDDAHLKSIEEVAKKLKKAGLKDSEVLAPVGIVSGSVDQNQRAALEGIAGVKAVEDEGYMSASGE